MYRVSEWFQAAAMPDRQKALGFKLRALSVWHVFALSSIGNSFFAGSGRPTINDAAAVLVMCRLNMERGKRLLNNEKRLIRACRKVTRRLRGKKVRFVLDEIQDYLNAGSRTSQRWEEDGKSSAKSSASPLGFALVRCLSREYGMSIYEAWDFPYGYAVCLMNTNAEANGDRSLVTESQQEAIELAQEELSRQ